MTKKVINGILKGFLEGRADNWNRRYRKLRGLPYRFDGEKPVKKRRFLQALLSDESKKKTYQKSRQCGVSETSVSELFFLCRKYQYKKFMYIFPTFPQMKDFVQTRIDPTIDDSAYISNMVSKNNIRVKHIDSCDVLFRGGFKSSSGEGTDIDCLFIDERDRMVQSTLFAFKEGLSSSELGYIRDISTPSLPGFGVNISFEQSDKKHWFIKCTKCNHWQNLSFPENIVYVKSEDRHAYKCIKCGGYDCLDRSDGEWVAQVQGNAEWSGYQVSQLDCYWITAGEIVSKHRQMALPQLFFNYVLGKPYAGTNLLVLQSHINSCLSSDVKMVVKSGPMLMGVDWGDISYAVIGMVYEGRLMIVHYEVITSRDPEEHIRRVNQMMEDFGVDVAVFDSGYGKVKNAILHRMTKSIKPGLVWACNYVDQAKSSQIENKWGKTEPKVTVNRTITLKVMARGWQKGEIILPTNLVLTNPHTETFFSQIKALASKWEEIDEGQAVERIGATGPDHFGHAMNYLYIGYYKVTERYFAHVGFLEAPGSKTIKIIKE